MGEAGDFRRFQAAIAKHLADVAGLLACHALIQIGDGPWREAARIGTVDPDAAQAAVAQFDPNAGGSVSPQAKGWLARYACAGPNVNLCLLFYLAQIPPQDLQARLQSLESKTGWLLVAALKSQEARQADLALSVDLGAAILLEASQAQTRVELADQWIARMESALTPDLVAVVWIDGDTPHLAAQSGGGIRERPSQAVQALQDIAQICVEQRVALAFDPAQDTRQPAIQERLVAALLELGAARALALPIYQDDACRAVLICLFSAKGDLPDAAASDLIAQVLAQSLAVQARAFPSLRHIARAWAIRYMRAIFGPKAAKIKLFAAAALVAVLVAALIPTTARPAFEARIEARNRFVVSAPFDGFLSEAPFQLGDTVTAGATVLALDDGDFRLQLARQVAEKQRLDGEAQAARSARDTAKVRTIEAQIEQTQVQIDLLNHQLAQTQLVAGRAGVVVGGDAWRRVGGRVRLGEPLLEVADPATYAVAAYIDESWVADLAAGRGGNLLLSAYPDRPIPVTLTQITADAQNRGGVNAFGAWARLDAPPDLPLLEGMRGIVRLDAGGDSLLGVYTRGLRQWLRKTVWRWE